MCSSEKSPGSSTEVAVVPMCLYVQLEGVEAKTGEMFEGS